MPQNKSGAPSIKTTVFVEVKSFLLRFFLVSFSPSLDRTRIRIETRRRSLGWSDYRRCNCRHNWRAGSRSGDIAGWSPCSGSSSSSSDSSSSGRHSSIRKRAWRQQQQQKLKQKQAAKASSRGSGDRLQTQKRSSNHHRQKEEQQEQQ